MNRVNNLLLSNRYEEVVQVRGAHVFDVLSSENRCASVEGGEENRSRSDMVGGVQVTYEDALRRGSSADAMVR